MAARISPEQADLRLRALIEGKFNHRQACDYLKSHGITITTNAFSTWLTYMARINRVDSTRLAVHYAATRMNQTERYALFSQAVRKMALLRASTIPRTRAMYPEAAYPFVRLLVGERMCERTVKAVVRDLSVTIDVMNRAYENIGAIIGEPGEPRWLRFLCVLDLYARVHPHVIAPPHSHESA